MVDLRPVMKATFSATLTAFAWRGTSSRGVKTRTLAKFGAVPLIAVATLGLTSAPSVHASPGMSRSAHVSADLPGPPWASSVALAADSDGLLEAFGTSNEDSSRVLYTRQPGPGNWIDVT